VRNSRQLNDTASALRGVAEGPGPMRASPNSFAKLLVVALAAAASMLLACGGSVREPTGTSTAKGVVGSYFLVTVFPPDNGFVDSTDGRIHCGPAGSGANACGPVSYSWSQTATLNATPQAGYGFQSWAGDCASTGACVLEAGADKYVIAIFAPAGQVGHPNFTSPALHGPAYLDLLGNVSGALNCAVAACHGTNLQGVGIAPDCFTCHAQAGWTSWQTNCSFCHGSTTPAAKAGYSVASLPELSAPPDGISQRLNQVAVPARVGAHQAHLTGVSASGTRMSARYPCEFCHAVPTSLSHVRGSTARANVVLSAQIPGNPATYNADGTCTTYCHSRGNAPSAVGTSPAWGSGAIACGGCHGAPPPAPHPPLSTCHVCHPTTVLDDGTIDPAGTHVNGHLDITGGGACNGCHGFPPDSGAHKKHDGLTTIDTFPSGYGDLGILATRVPGATPTTAPAVYAFGCGNCHPLDAARHMDGVVEIELYDASATAGSLKRLSSPTASYDASAKTCSGTYCHSSGQATPAFVATPGWTSGVHLGCDGCHSNPPRYDSGAPGSATANGHVNLAEDGWEYGHFAGLAGPWHSSKHGGAYVAGDDSSAITCQTCHFDTTDPANTGPSGFYYLDTSGAYQLPGGDASRVGTLWYQQLQCTSCHSAGSATAPLGSGKVLPLRHVNGTRDVVFDPRDTLPDIAWLPPAPDRPTAPYWVTSSSRGLPWPANVIWSGTTASFSVRSATFDRTTKTCSNVACHLADVPVWGDRDGSSKCRSCHPMR